MCKFVLLVLLVMASSGAAAEWVKVGDSPAPDGFDVYADPATIRRAGNMVKMWGMVLTVPP